MNVNLVTRGAVFAASLISLVAINPIHAQDTLQESGAYNAGFLASESGDYTTAATQWQPLAAKGDAIAQFNLALMYHRGLGVHPDESAAVSWYHKSAENGYPKAQEFLAAAYREGWFGLAQDQQKADYWSQQLENSSF
jgi:TPR repeat protein